MIVELSNHPQPSSHQPTHAGKDRIDAVNWQTTVGTGWHTQSDHDGRVGRGGRGEEVTFPFEAKNSKVHGRREQLAKIQTFENVETRKRSIESTSTPVMNKRSRVNEQERGKRERRRKEQIKELIKDKCKTEKADLEMMKRIKRENDCKSSKKGDTQNRMEQTGSAILTKQSDIFVMKGREREINI